MINPLDLRPVRIPPILVDEPEEREAIQAEAEGRVKYEPDRSKVVEKDKREARR